MTEPEATARAVQAEVEGVSLGDETEPTIEFKGERFGVADRVNLMAIMKMAVVAKRGADANDMDGFVALYGVLKTCIAKADWDRFERHAEDTCADGDEMMAAYQAAIEKIAARPTQRSSGSPAGPRTTSPNLRQIRPLLSSPDETGELVDISDLLQARSTA